MSELTAWQSVLGLGVLAFSIVLPLLARLSDVVNNQRIMKEQNDAILYSLNRKGEHLDRIEERVKSNTIRLRQVKEQLKIPETDIS